MKYCSFFIFALLISLGCSNDRGVIVKEIEGGNLTIAVSNQSGDIDPVDIDVYIDGIKYIAGTYYVGDQHNVDFYSYDIEDGNHELTVSSAKHGISTSISFEVEGTCNIYIPFWYQKEKMERPEFGVRVSKEPILLL